MKWLIRRIGDYFEVRHGFAFEGELFADEGRYIVVTPRNFYEKGGFKHTPDKDKFYIGTPKDSFILRKGDLILAMTEQGPGLLGSPAWVPCDDLYLHNQRIGLVTELRADFLDPRFLFYRLNTYEVRAQVQATATGTKVRHTAPSRIQDVRVPLPDLPTQRRIADILSAYDDLIENNRRRMALLEESVHLLYREWFVRLRFPGHERVKVVDGLPEGWARVTLGEFAPLQYGKALPAETRVVGDVPVFGSSGIVGTHRTALVNGSGIVVGRKGNVGSVFWSSKPFFPIDTVFYIAGERVSEHLFQTLKTLNFVNSDAAVPGLNRNSAHAQSFLAPPAHLIEELEVVARPVRALSETIATSNQKLAEARDLLLPRLMDGSLPV